MKKIRNLNADLKWSYNIIKRSTFTPEFKLLAGKITIGDYTVIGIGASIKEEITIGSNAIIGAGSVVINDVPNDTTVYGVPAKTANS